MTRATRRSTRAPLLLLAPVSLSALLASAPAEAQQVLHQVRINETMRSIALEYYGDKRKASFLRKVNDLEPRAKLQIASRLRIPTAWIYVVPRTITLRSLAKRLLGDSRRYLALQAFNGDLRRRRVKKGTEVLVPYPVRHVVESDDTFIKLARQYFGDGKRAKLIVQYNLLKGTKPSPRSTLLIPVNTRILPAKLRQLTNERVLGVGGNDREKGSLRQANAALRQGRYWYVPLLLLRMLAAKMPYHTHLASVFRHLATAYVALGRNKLATMAFKEALLRQPGLTLNPISTSPKVIEALARAKGAKRD
ncbi:MAG: hypothetical protein CSA65_04970 [Proteobacteria bacterium]|nr:MAG: hypothetical protein CSB49_05905 [Pseudomonadota bacterium]PIE18468.1 MAG: hypothetical protein CSA65_04970 [Pseudomonadota bacterium]